MRNLGALGVPRRFGDVFCGWYFDACAARTEGQFHDFFETARDAAGARSSCAIRGLLHQTEGWGSGTTHRRDRRLSKHSARSRRRPVLQLETLEPRVVLSGVPVISEFQAVNDRVLFDEDGEDSDWIELHNTGDSDMSLSRWYLTDDADNLQKWRFPDVQLDAAGYLVVFASNKDRDDPAGELHTNFRLDADGEYLALVQPDGRTIAFEIGPDVPPQVTDVSYGIPTGTEYSHLIRAGNDAQVLIPRDGSLDPSEPDVLTGTWLDPNLELNDDWIQASTGVGYAPSDNPVVVADSAEDFSGVQGQDNWRYGIWTENFDPDGLYSVDDFQELNASSAFDAEGNRWTIGTGVTAEITAQGGRPTSVQQGFLANSVIRRWVSETEGELTISGTLANPDPAGDGVLGRVLLNGNEVYQRQVNGGSVEYSFTVQASVGDLVDFLISAGVAENAIGDDAEFTASIEGVPLHVVPTVELADSSGDWSNDGIQGLNGWYFGYYSLLEDADRTYQAGDFRVFGPSEWGARRWELASSGFDTQIRLRVWCHTAMRTRCTGLCAVGSPPIPAR